MPYDYSPTALFRLLDSPRLRRVGVDPPFAPETSEFTCQRLVACRRFPPRVPRQGAGGARARAHQMEVRRVLRRRRDGGLPGGDAGRPAVLAFRGTQAHDWKDVKADMRLPLVRFQDGANVHLGFSGSARARMARVAARLEEHAERGGKVWYTGTALAARWRSFARHAARPTRWSPSAPRVGDAGFNRLLPAAGAFRVVNCCDLVPTMPPEAFGYRHGGALRFLTTSGACRPERLRESTRSRCGP